MNDTAFRPATRGDAAVLAELVNDAGQGLPLYLWEQMKEPGESAWDVGRRRAARDEGAFSWRNAIVIECEGEAAGCLIGYGIAAAPEPIPDDFPVMFRPLQALENLAPGSWYVNVLAVLPVFRNRGFGRRLLARAEEIARAERRGGMSLIVADANAGARRLYERVGYREAARRPMVKEGWAGEGRHWLLLTKPL